MTKLSKSNIHFVGIGGIGVSALARYYLGQNCKITGSDLASSEITDALKKLGAKISIGQHNAKNFPRNTDLVIYSPAVPLSNSEIKAAKKLKIPAKSYPEALGGLTKTHFTIAVSGTHGKSTTTSMLGLLLTKAGLDPTVIVGTKLKEFGNSNCRIGKLTSSTNGSKFLVIEADEHFGSFLNYSPDIIVLTTIEADHLDYYKNLGNLIKAFKEYIGNLKDNGIVVYNRDDQNISNLKMPKTWFSAPKVINRFRHKNSKPQLKTQNYSLKQKEAKGLKKILKVPGEYNVSNALAALTVARYLKIPDKISFKALSEYQGAWRRFEIIKTKPFILISDYGHHPTEVKVTLKAAREKYPNKKIICVFQPHQYQRTFYLFKDFVKALKEAPVDELLIAEIYDVAGREGGNFKQKVNSEKLTKAINKKSAKYFPTLEEIETYLKKTIKPGSVVIVMGAGDIYKLISKLNTLE